MLTTDFKNKSKERGNEDSQSNFIEKTSNNVK